MKKIVYYILGAAAMLAAASCAKNVEWDEITPEDGQQGISLQFSDSAMGTKAGEDEGTEAKNYEDRVDRILFFVFPLNESGTVNDDAEYVFSGSYSGEDGNGWTYTAASGTASEKWVYSKTMTTEELNALFPNGATKAKVFAIANYVGEFGANNDMASPDTTFPEDVKTWKGMHELKVGATFFYDDKDPDFLLRWPHVLPVDDERLFFVMTSEADLELNKTGVSKADCKLERLASKVTANFTYQNFREEKKNNKGEVTSVIMWIPQETAGETRVYLSNAIEHTTLGGPLPEDYTYVADSWATATKPLGNGTRDIFEYSYNFMNDVPVIDGKKTAHFYTYPINAKEGDDNQPYLKLVLPWYGYKWVGEGTAPADAPADIATNANWQQYKQKEVYYKIVLPRETIKEPNRIYEYTVNVNIIGSDKEVKIIGEQYVVKDWLFNDAISSNVATGRYISLEIPKDEYDMYVDEIKINFVSSGTVVAKIEEIYQLNYSNATGVSKDYFMQSNAVVATNNLRDAKGIARGDAGDAVIKGWVTIPSATSYLRINHEMCNDITVTPVTKFDAAPYVYKVTLHLEEAGDDTSFDRTITITQYPSIYIEMETDTPFIRPDLSGTYYSGYVYINNEQSTDVYWDYVDYVSTPYTGTGRNANPNLYTITTTIPPASLGYIIGDPRKTSIDNLGGSSIFASAVALYGNSPRSLTYYYPTDDSDQTKSVIAPKYMLPSSYGKNYYAISLQDAKRRCAAYQENGYPAGRWRVPTKSEIEYITSLSAKGFIPSLFNTAGDSGVGSDYWSSHGTVQIQTDGTVKESNKDSGFVRCVYDIWYWGNSDSDKVDFATFTWGDKQR